MSCIRQTHCSHGHDLKGSNLGEIVGKRRIYRWCKTCRANSFSASRFDRLQKMTQYHKYTYRIRYTEFLIMTYGTKCACCGTSANLTLDHIDPSTKTKYSGINLFGKVKQNPEEFQLLCQPCNSWKDTGPCCPCPFWDLYKPEWRHHAKRK